MFNSFGNILRLTSFGESHGKGVGGGGMYFGEKYQDNDKAYDTNMYTRPEIERILKVAFEYAKRVMLRISGCTKRFVREETYLLI